MEHLAGRQNLLEHPFVLLQKRPIHSLMSSLLLLLFCAMFTVQ